MEKATPRNLDSSKSLIESLLGKSKECEQAGHHIGLQREIGPVERGYVSNSFYMCTNCGKFYETEAHASGNTTQKL